MPTAIDFEILTGQLSISGVNLRGPAWHVLDLFPLWSSPTLRGQDRILPTAAGVRPFRRRRTVTVRSLEMVVVGDCDRFGDVIVDCDEADYAAQLQENIDYLLDNVVEPPGTQDGTRDAILTMPDGTTRTADVHVVGFDLHGGRYDITGVTLTLSIPNGRFE